MDIYRCLKRKKHSWEALAVFHLSLQELNTQRLANWNSFGVHMTLPSPGDLIVAYLAVSTRRSRRGKLTKLLLTLIAESPSVTDGLYQPFQ